MAAHLGAHEVMEVHEVLTNTINCINHFELYRPHVRDQRLNSLLSRQVQFMAQDYNNMVRGLSGHPQGGQAVPYRNPKNAAPVYGLDNPRQQSPNLTINQLDDHDIASGMLGCHKASAVMKMTACLECADPNLRRMIQQSANNCAEQAYEVWQFMNQSGYYQVPTMQENTTNTMLNTYGTLGNAGAIVQNVQNNNMGYPATAGHMGHRETTGLMGTTGQRETYESQRAMGATGSAGAITMGTSGLTGNWNEHRQ